MVRPQVDVGKAKLIMDDSFSTSREDDGDPKRIYFDHENPVSCWEENGVGHDGRVVEICIAPVLVCTEVRQTAGGGDNISAGGLVLQI
jgi:ADP-dependent glucokinase